MQDLPLFKTAAHARNSATVCAYCPLPKRVRWCVCGGGGEDGGGGVAGGRRLAFMAHSLTLSQLANPSLNRHSAALAPALLSSFCLDQFL